MYKTILFAKAYKYNIRMKNFFYRVAEGDTLYGLSQKFNVSATEILAENNLKREIERGDVLYIPAPSRDYYFVKAEDTISSICKKLNISPERLREKNQNIPYVFYGMKLKY